MSQTHPQLTGLLESAIYVDDVERSMAFYQGALGLEQLVHDDGFAAFSVAGRQVLLVFKHGEAITEKHSPNGTIPPHDATGRVHLAFSIDAGTLDAWEESLGASGIAIESRVTWPRGGRSVYFRDPDGHLVELATPGVWAIY